MANARYIVEKACKKIHVLGRGQTLSADEASDGLSALNDMLSSFSADVSLIFNSVGESFPLTGQQSYTIGTGGAFNTARPLDINAMYVRIGSTDYLLTPMNAAEYAAIPFKAAQGTPEKFYYDNNTPLSRINLYPVGVTGTLYLDSLKALTSFANLTTDYPLADGAVEMLVYNLAVRLAPDYEMEASDTVKRMAAKTLQTMEVFNRRNDYPKANLDIASDGSDGNIMSGWLNR